MPPALSIRRASTALLLALAVLTIVFRMPSTPPPRFKPSQQYLVIQPTASSNLTRMSNVGMEFYDKWNSLEGELAESTRAKIYNGFGNDLLDKNECTSGNPKRPAIAVRFASHGFGQNLIQLANYIISVGLQEQNQLFFLQFNETQSRKRVGHHAFQLWFEQRFSLVHQHGTACDVFLSKCDKSVGRCYDAYWEANSTNAKRSMWKQATYFMDAYRLRNLQEHNLLKAMVIREIMRLLPETRQELDWRHDLVLAPHKFDKQIAMHVRRTDKITGEAQLVECTVFAQVLDMVLDMDEFATAGNVLVHLLSDEYTVLAEFNRAFAASKHKHRVTIAFRHANMRPDRVQSEEQVTESFFQVLVDFRLMISSNAFIGSQSSNLGVTSCLLRAYKHCYTVEEPFPFSWNSAEDKIA